VRPIVTAQSCGSNIQAPSLHIQSFLSKFAVSWTSKDRGPGISCNNLNRSQRDSFHFCCTGEKDDFVEYGVGKSEVRIAKRESLRIHRFVALKKNLSISSGSASAKVCRDLADLPPLELS
jgi:hypothetical protein